MGLADQSLLQAELNRLIASARRHGHALCVGLVGVEGFEELTSEHGRDAGEAVLRRVGAALDGRLRASDMVGRWEDDRFLVLLPDTPPAGAERVAGDLRATVETTAPPTVSVGWAEWTGESPGELLQRVENALAAATLDGGNSVRRYS